MPPRRRPSCLAPSPCMWPPPEEGAGKRISASAVGDGGLCIINVGGVC